MSLENLAKKQSNVQITLNCCTGLRVAIFCRKVKPMNQSIGQRFPDIELPDQDGQRVRLSPTGGKNSLHPFILPGLLVREMPGAVAPLRSTPRRTRHQVLYKLAVVSVDSPEVNAAFRTGLGAEFPFLAIRIAKSCSN